jgi:hypothetical protein
MANILRTITLTVDPAAAGPLYDVYYSTDCVNYTICIDGSSVSLPTVGSTANVTFPDNTTCIKLVNLSSGCGNNFVVEALTVFDYLVVAGGAGGGRRHGGGGGAGGLQSGSLTIQLSTPYNITVGAGGAAGAIGNSSIFNLITSIGGGFGGSGAGSGSNGGSGGGGSSINPWGSGSVGQGKAGGAGVVTGTPGNNGYAGGGGGGASEIGQFAFGSSAPGTQAGKGGSGSVWEGTFYAGGGGGGNYTTTTFGVGGIGGGGNGSSSGVGQSGTANTGGGGGGNGDDASDGGSGGSGIVRIKYASTFSASISVGLTATTLTTGSFKITTFTAGTGTVSFI